jgi:hypothetical protein
MATPVFYSFHFDNDVFRVQQVRNIGALEDNKPVSPNEWEQVRRSGDEAIKRWIAANMNYRRCVVVLVGLETAERRWVRYEIEKAWNDGKGLFGIYIHNLRCPRAGTCTKGSNPFDQIRVGQQRLSSIVPCYDPPSLTAYQHIASNMEAWVQRAIAQRKAVSGLRDL